MSRRNFLKSSIPAGFMIPSFLNGVGIRAYDTGHQFLNNLLLPAGENDRVLVIVQLNGGNDGLNTIIPLEYFSKYVNARKNIYIEEAKSLKLSGVTKIGLHPSMTGLQQLYNDGKLHIVQSVGYPQPNFSHFRATDIWMGASDSNQVLNTGWVGRYLDETFPGFPSAYPSANMPDPLAIQIGSVTSLALQGPTQPMGLSISNPSSFYNFVNNISDPVPKTNAGKELSFIRELSRQTQKYGEVIKGANTKVTLQNPYPSGNSLADQLKIVARLIKGGLKTKIYMVNFGGFDTHSSQTNTGDSSTGKHATLLSTVSAAIKAFQDDLVFLGIEDRVLGMTFSEFGRRILGNNSLGTDHGAAAPLFIFGKNVKAGITGSTPLIPDNVTVNDNVPYQYDFRSVYATLLSNWLCVNTTVLNQVMLKDFQQLSITKPGTCNVVTSTNSFQNPAVDQRQLIQLYPNPFHKVLTIEFNTLGGHTLLQVIDGSGKLLATIFDRDYSPGKFRVDFDGGHLPAGIYYVRFQNQVFQQVRSIVKV
jgi:uncharacterized protein (DUF1501 family)